jgi:hypothetical protein
MAGVHDDGKKWLLYQESLSTLKPDDYPNSQDSAGHASHQHPSDGEELRGCHHYAIFPHRLRPYSS